MTFNERTAEYRALAEAHLKKALRDSDILLQLKDAMWYSVEAGGKRLRPCLLLAACEMGNGLREAALPLAAAIELIHTYSLIHDDLPCMDNDDFRRGKPTSHKVFGEANALLAGDGLLSYAFELMLKAQLEWCAKVSDYGKAIYAIARGAGVYGMVAGQFADLAATGKEKSGAEELRYIHAHKTGALITAAVMGGAHLGDFSDVELEHIQSYSEKYGVLFQITDDILDVTGDFESMGKTLGKDAAQDKTTYVTLFGLDKSRLLAQDVAADAKAELARLDRDTSYFEQLVDYTLGRKK